MPTGLHHVELYLSDLPRGRSSWSWLLERLGYTLYQEWDEGFSFRLGDCYIVFVQAEERFSDQAFHRCHPGLNHLAFHAESRHQVQQLRRQAIEHGFRELYPERFPHAGGREHYALYLEDPQRLKLEIVAPETR